MKLLKLSISGVRGVVGETITPELVLDFACAFGTMLPPGPVIVGRDTRKSGPMIQQAVVSALLSTGHQVLDFDICPTPIIQFSVKKERVRGAISITAGHNPAEWNALNFINNYGTYLNEFQGSDLLDIYHLNHFRFKSPKQFPGISHEVNPEEVYFSWLKNKLRVQEISQAKFKVVVDPCNGAGSKLIDRFLGELGVEPITVNNEGSGYFPHDPEPRPRNAGEVASLVRATGAQVGFLLNSDCSRVSLVTETGETLSEEYTLPLVASYYLRWQPGPVITNLSTSMMIEAVAKKFGLPLVRTKVGQSSIIQTMLQEEAAVAGEGSGGLALKNFQPAFDGFVVIGLILERMAVEQRKLSELVKELPHYHIVKDKIFCPPHRLHSLVAETKKLYPGKDINSTDGLRITGKDFWVHIRASTTEPIIRIVAESPSRNRAQLEVDKVMAFLKRLSG
ncbi:MAG: phosphoglucosamine mutase [Candidatus Saccharicenans sp.]|nr:MAG: phosphoglucosamine mutase [Candidatus Aminicenantes bacterium]HEK86356.1 phosphoglucosamine mutase [Candidatus Aminicenantes bacterium]